MNTVNTNGKPGQSTQKPAPDAKRGLTTNGYRNKKVLRLLPRSAIKPNQTQMPRMQQPSNTHSIHRIQHGPSGPSKNDLHKMRPKNNGGGNTMNSAFYYGLVVMVAGGAGLLYYFAITNFIFVIMVVTGAMAIGASLQERKERMEND